VPELARAARSTATEPAIRTSVGYYLFMPRARITLSSTSPGAAGEDYARLVNVVIFGGLKRRPFPAGWTKETVVAILGGADLDLSSSPPGTDARLTTVSILGGVKIVVAPGTPVSTSGFSLLGGRDVKVSQGGEEGPEIKMNLWAFLGGVEVTEATAA
jgi:hypothetical protein